MLRQSGLRSRKRRSGLRAGEDDVNPMEGAINIVDAMLVFACGLMLSLVIYWNIDIQNKELVPVKGGEQVTDIETNAGAAGAEDGSGKYEELGKVYVDPKTGKMYLVKDDDAK